MIVSTVSGNLGKDAQLRDAGGERVCSFSVASSTKRKGEEVTTWVDCSIWGKRGESLAPHLKKGTKLVVVGELGTREHNGKTYLTLRVDQLEFTGGKRSDEAPAPAPTRTTDYDAPPGDDIPF